ncbi:MAG: TRZ/ATZ family hydrolase [Bdellovibrionales bacterium]|jgi:5-methylthioadenosine/S-adenosylhomocysteine deaminase|nr:TRZ/ATZ family hydrolase [Bdellovibrionales bacterium]MBT3525253.1 TRZ/ATZ family hydrolase [Bdellovibrionales bacterium]MBT7668895.1 TRZ/ATZ family hydrolase [Bdellovibrionales bacterium]
MSDKSVDLIISGKWVVTVDPSNQVLYQHAVAIKDGKIVAIIPNDNIHSYQTKEFIERPEHIIMPGLINAHTHSPMTLMRGMADDLPLMEWLEKHIWPTEQKWLGEEYVKIGSELAIAEMIRGGTTCFNDMYFFPGVTAKVAQQTGIRVMVGLITINFPTAWAQNGQEYLAKGIEEYKKYQNGSTVHWSLAPHAPYTVTDELFEATNQLSKECRNLKVHLHLHETSGEIEQSVQEFKIRPIERIKQLGLLDQRLIAIHMTQLLESEIGLLADCQAHVVHCPQSNLKLASGFAPIQQLLEAGVNVALGTDSAASNNSLNMFAELRCAALLAKGVAKNATALPAWQAIRMATINGACALGVDQLTGSIEIGKSADLITVDMGQLEQAPLYDPLSHLVYTCDRHQVCDLLVQGRLLLKERELKTIDYQRISQACLSFTH